MLNRVRSLLRQWRWRRGRGWSEDDFAVRYRRAEEDAWGYRRSARHAARFDRVLAVLPQRAFSAGLEIGCAEGDLTERLAPRVAGLVAMDIAGEAVARAAARLGERFPHVSFVRGDVRTTELPEGRDLVVCADVLYYLTPREIAGAVASLAAATVPGGALVFANEWAPHYQGLTPPDAIRRLIHESGCWCEEHWDDTPLEGGSLAIGRWRRDEGKPS